MKANKKRILVTLCVMVWILGNGFPVVWVINTMVQADYVPPGPNEVKIVFSGIDMPLGRIILVRNQKNCCAVKFTRFRTEQDKRGDFVNKFADYEVYYQPDGTGDFLRNNVELIRDYASMLRPRGPFYPLVWQPGRPAVKCGSLNLAWDYKGFLCFFEQKRSPKDYGIELAPTPWQEISQVNLSDPRIRWYRYDANRKILNIPIDNLWSNSETEK